MSISIRPQVFSSSYSTSFGTKQPKKTNEDNCSNCDSISKAASDAIKAAVMPSVNKLGRKGMPNFTIESVLSGLKEPISIEGKVVFDPQNFKQKVDTQFLNKFVNDLNFNPVKFKDPGSDKYTECELQKIGNAYMLSFKTVEDSDNLEPKKYKLYFNLDGALSSVTTMQELSFSTYDGESKEISKFVSVEPNGDYRLGYTAPYGRCLELEVGARCTKDEKDGKIKTYKFFNPNNDFSMYEERYVGKINDESVTEFIKNYIDDYYREV